MLVRRDHTLRCRAVIDDCRERAGSSSLICAAFVWAPKTPRSLFRYRRGGAPGDWDPDAVVDVGGAMRVGPGACGMTVEPGVDVGPGFPPASVGRGVCDILLAFMTRVAVGKTVGVGRSVAVANGEAVAEGCRLGEGNAVAVLLSALTVTVTVLVAICSVGVADGSVVAVAVAVSSGTTTVC